MNADSAKFKVKARSSNTSAVLSCPHHALQRSDQRLQESREEEQEARVQEERMDGEDG